MKFFSCLLVKVLNYSIPLYSDLRDFSMNWVDLLVCVESAMGSMTASQTPLERITCVTINMTKQQITSNVSLNFISGFSDEKSVVL